MQMVHDRASNMDVMAGRRHSLLRSRSGPNNRGTRDGIIRLSQNHSLAIVANTRPRDTLAFYQLGADSLSDRQLLKKNPILFIRRWVYVCVSDGLFAVCIGVFVLLVRGCLFVYVTVCLFLYLRGCVGMLGHVCL